MSIPISQLVDGGLPNGDIEIPATNPLNTTQSIYGTTFKYILADILQYILIAQGFTTYTSCRVATTAALTATYANGIAGVGATLTNAGAQVVLSVDGITLVANDRVLIKNQINTFENGIYVVTDIGSATTDWILTRATDYNESSEIVYLGVVAITQGTQNAGLVFQENSQGPFVIGTSPITFQQLQIDISLLPSASPANKILRSDGTYWVQSTNASLSSTDVLTNLTELQVDNININGNTISSIDVGGNIVITPNTVGSIVLDGLNWPQVDGTANQAITTDGSGQLGWSTVSTVTTPTTDKAIAIFNGTGGALQNSTITIPTSNILSGVVAISDISNNTSLLLGAAVSSVNYLQITNAATGNPVSVTAVGSDTDVALYLAGKGSTQVRLGNDLLMYNTSGGNNYTKFIVTATGAKTVTIPDLTGTMAISGAGQSVSFNSLSLTTPLGISSGGTNASTIGANGTLAQSDGTKYTFTTATFPSTATATGTILRADGTNWVATTATYPATTTINQILYSSANNVIGEITTANSATLVTSSTGVPGYTGSMTNGQLVIGSTGATPVVGSITGAGSITVTPGAGTIQISSSAGGVVNAGIINELAYYAATGSAVSGLATANNGVLITSGAGVPSISSTLPNTVQGNITSVGTIGSGTWQGNTIAVGYGGTGATSIGANGTLAQSNGSIYTFTTATYPSTTTANRLLYSSATNTVTDLATANSATLVTDTSGVPAWTSSMTNGQVLIGSTGATPVLSTLTAAGGITITNAAGSITISGSGGGFSWTEVTGVAQTMVANNGYVTSNAGQVVLTLPATSVIGDTIKVQGKGTGGWKVAQNAGQLIHFNSSTTTLGVLGYIESTQRYNSVELVCITNTNEWAVNSASGNLTVF